MTSKQKKSGLFPVAANAGGDYREEMSTELGLTEQEKVSKSERTATKTKKQ